MAVIIDLELCTGDGECVDECPLELFTLVDGKAFQEDPDECVECGRCTEVCEQGALSLP
ncbi:MAG: 4Fe-4S binding protein [Coriobacteriia bacterium]|nr:4Fe-4S binding protein [Coriobacteriia bacterium]